MSIQSYVQELEAIRGEIKILNEKKKKLNVRVKTLEGNISEYLKSKDQPGVKYNGKEIILERKEVPGPKKPKERDSDSLKVLEKYGIKDSSKVLEELMNARKGDLVTKDKIKVTKMKQSK